MRVVFANKYYYVKGGAERYLFDLFEQLKAQGHKPIPFAMQDERNRPTPWSRFFVSPVQTSKVSFGWQGLRTAGRALYSFEAKRKFGKLLDAAKPELVHIHNIYRQISPSILPEATKRGLPVVATVHDYALIAPNYSLYHDGRVCEVTRPDRFFKAVGHRCVKGSKVASWLAAAELSLHRRLGLYSDNVRLFLTPSRFLKAIMVDYGLPADRIETLPLFIDPDRYSPSFGRGDYVLFVGRLSEEKGLKTLIRAAAKTPKITYRIVGTGPEEKALKYMVRDMGLANVEFRGWKSGPGLADEYAGARFVVVPSEWYEVFGLVALEAYANGKPVIASEIGGLAEVVKNGETGILTSAGQPDHWAEAIGQLWQSPDIAEKMGRAGRAWLESDFSPEAHLEGLLHAYRRLGMKV